MPTRNINLTEHFDRFVEEQIGAGKYANASEVLRAGLRLLELQQQTEAQKIELLQKLATEGFHELDQGAGITAASEKELRGMIARIGRKAVKGQKKPQAK